MKLTNTALLVGICHVNKISTQQPVDILHTLLISNRPLGSIGMGLVGTFPKLNRFDYL